MENTFYEVRTFINGRASGVLPSRFSTKEEAITFADMLKRLDDKAAFDNRIYKVTEIDY